MYRDDLASLGDLEANILVLVGADQVGAVGELLELAHGGVGEAL